MKNHCTIEYNIEYGVSSVTFGKSHNTPKAGHEISHIK